MLSGQFAESRGEVRFPEIPGMMIIIIIIIIIIKFIISSISL